MIDRRRSFSRPLRDWSTHSWLPSTACWAIIRPSLRDSTLQTAVAARGLERNAHRTEQLWVRSCHDSAVPATPGKCRNSRDGAQPRPRLLLPGQKDCGQVQQSWCNGVKAFEKIRFRPMYSGANMGHPSRTEDHRCESRTTLVVPRFRRRDFATTVVAVCCKLLYPATVDWRTISFGSTKAVCGRSSSGLVASTSTRRAAASPMRWIDWSTDVSGTLKYSA
jgi:hypothetical protein